MNTEPNIESLLQSYTHDGQLVTERFVATRSGKRVHAQYPGSTVTRCGHWQKATARYFEVAPSVVQAAHLCASCFPEHATTRLPKAASPETREARQRATAAEKAERERAKLARRVDRARKTLAKTRAFIEAEGLDLAAESAADLYRFAAQLQPTVFDCLLDEAHHAKGEPVAFPENDCRAIIAGAEAATSRHIPG